MPDTAGRLYVREVAVILNVHENTVRNMANAGTLPCWRIRGGEGFRRFDPKEVEVVRLRMLDEAERTIRDKVAKEIEADMKVHVGPNNSHGHYYMNRCIAIARGQVWPVEDDEEEIEPPRRFCDAP